MNINITDALSALRIRYESYRMSILKLNVKRAPVMSMFIERLLFGFSFQKSRSVVQFHDESWLNLSYIQLNMNFEI